MEAILKSGALTVGILAVALSAGVPVTSLAQSASPQPAATALPSAAADATVMPRAKEWLHRLQTGDIDRAQLSDKMNAALTPDMAKQAAAKFGPLGDPKSFTYSGQQAHGDDTAYMFRVTFASGAYDEVFVINAQGKVDGLFLPPAQ